MIKGLYTSALGMTTMMRNMDVIADNIANVNTTGFKKDRVATRSFTEELLVRLSDPGDAPFTSVPMGRISQGVFVDDIYTDHSGGGLRKTAAPLDLAITGRGFFCVAPADATDTTTEMYTRDGAFTLGYDGLLLTKEGNPVLGVNGMIRIPPGNITVSDDGSIFSNDEFIDRLRMTDFADTHELRKGENNLFRPTVRAVQTDFTGRITSGYLENSNVNSIRELTNMMTTTRAFKANQRMITAHDTILNRVSNDLGRK
jgi:flagellar basal-body rod protein FlgG